MAVCTPSARARTETSAGIASSARAVAVCGALMLGLALPSSGLAQTAEDEPSVDDASGADEAPPRALPEDAVEEGAGDAADASEVDEGAPPIEMEIEIEVGRAAADEAPPPSQQLSPPTAAASSNASSTASLASSDNPGATAGGATPEASTSPEAPSGLLPTAAAERPLTLPAGMGLLGFGFSASFGGVTASIPIDFALGITDDLTVGVRYSILGEPEVRATGRVYHDDVVEFGFRGLVRIPAFYQGDTVLAAEAALLLRPVSFLKIQLALGLDLLLSDPVLPLVYAPAQVEVSLTKHFFVGVDGWAGWDDGFWLGGLGGYLGFTVASPRRPIMDLRLGARAEIPRGDVTILVSHVFYPDLF